MSRNHEWLDLIEVSGPFLALPVLRDVFPQGMEELEAIRARRLRSAYEEWRDAVDSEDSDLGRLHQAWIDEVLSTALDADDKLVRHGGRIPAATRVGLPEHDTSIIPDIALVDPTRSDALLLPVQVYSPDTDLVASTRFGRLACSPSDLMATYLRAVDSPLGVVTNGERWMVVHAPVGQVSTFASWYARLWGQEPETLRAFVSLVGVRRLFGREQDRLPSLFERSLKHQDEVTDALGEQVRRAIEVLVQALDRADQDRNRELLRDVKPQELYEAGLTVMMRLVFLLAAEERGLLLLGEPRYDSFYAVSTLRMQLRAENEEILERRRSAWSRLLAVFRAVFGGIEHPTLHLPAMGGSLFDPDRFPFLEGRLKGSSWRHHPAAPVPIDDRTVLLLLDAIQTFKGRTLSYRALDVEQIGYVYEGLLERTVTRVHDVTLELDSGAQANDPRVTLGELESARIDGQGAVVALLVEKTRKSESSIRNALDRDLDARLGARLLTACRGDVALRDRLKQYGWLIRTDPWGYPLVHPKGAFVVVMGIDRRETGTHYTPKSLTEKIVEETLTPLVYDGPAIGAPNESWTLKPPEALLDLKVCDPAMGSGAFLVQVCRFLSARLVEAWGIAENGRKVVDVEGRVHEAGAVVEPLPRVEDARAEQARRLVAERCLYGVDVNSLAVELAKLSLWLVTLAKGRPFGFLDHNLRHGDSLLGIDRLKQLTELTMAPADRRQGRLFGSSVRKAVNDALSLRMALREMQIRDIRDIEAMANLDAEARAKLKVSERLADAFIATVFAADNARVLEARLAALSSDADRVCAGDEATLTSLCDLASACLQPNNSDSQTRAPFHWPLEFPEVFERNERGFDAIVGNPPFMGGRIIGRRLGETYQEHLKLLRNYVPGSPDLCAYFFLRAYALVRSTGHVGMLATKSLAETGSRIVCLDQILARQGTIRGAVSRMPWPGKASVVVAIVWLTKDSWSGRVVLDGHPVQAINGGLEEELGIARPVKLKYWKGRFSQGQDIMGRGFELTIDERDDLLQSDPTSAEVVFPLFNGQDLNNLARLEPYRWVIYFRDWPEVTARRFRAAFERVHELVKPYRDSLTGQIHQDCYWKFWDLRPQLIRELDRRTSVLASAINSKYVLFRRVPTGNVYNKKTKLYFIDTWWEFSILQSTFHQEWAFWTCGTLGASTINYSTSAALETWPMPPLEEQAQADLERIGDSYHTLREHILVQDGIGLTDLYNRFHDPKEAADPVARLRDLQVQMDYACARAYGWDEQHVQHGFFDVGYLPEDDRVRFTISSMSRTTALRNLAALNRKQNEGQRSMGGDAPATQLASVDTDAGALAAPATKARTRRNSR